MTDGAVAPVRLRRDRVTLALYAHFVAWGWLLYSFSPSVPLLAAEQGITKAQGGLHGTAMAVGTVLSALVSARFVARLGRRGTLLAAGVVLIAGVGLLVTGAQLAATLAGALVSAVGGTLMLSAATPALALHHREASAAAVTEANGVGALFGLMGPLAVGACVAAGAGWRPAVGLTIALAGIAAAAMASLPSRGALGTSALKPASFQRNLSASRTVRSGDAGFSGTFWWFWSALIAAVAIENGTIFWAADLLISRTGAGPGIATGAIAGLIAGMCAARFVVGPMSLRRAPEKLLLVAFALAGVGWAILWFATTTPVALAGLVIAGLGYGVHYPLLISLMLRSSEGRPDQAQARGTLGAGAAIGVAPFLLGALADAFGTHTAFLLVPILIVVGAAAVVLGLRSVRRAAHPYRPVVDDRPSTETRAPSKPS